jgi:CO/xanthine dehydrogenase Mo-binding subunit
MVKVIKTKREFEGHWFEEHVVAEGDRLKPWEAGADLRYVGQGRPRIDGAERVNGRALFTMDIQLPGMLHGKILRSPHPHARIKRINTKGAEELMGVRAVLSYENSPKIPFMGVSLSLDYPLNLVFWGFRPRTPFAIS